jgi:carboxylesterase type B
MQVHRQPRDMLKMRFSAFLFMCVCVSIAQAKDVSIQQAAYNNALQKMERAEAEHKANMQAVADTEKLLEMKKKQLAEEQKKAEISRKNYQVAREKLEQAQSALDKAWKE